MYQRIQFPLRPAAAKIIHKGQGITEDEAVVDLTQHKGVRKIPMFIMSHLVESENWKIYTF